MSFLGGSGSAATVSDIYAIAPFGLTDYLVTVAGLSAVADGLGGNYRWSDTDTSADDGVNVLQPTMVSPGNPGRWLRINLIPGPVSVSPSTVTRSFNSNFQPSTTKTALVNYAVDVAATISLATGQSGTVYLETSPNGSTGWVELDRHTNANSGSLTIGLNLTDTNTGTLSGTVPAGYYVRLRTVNNTGAPTFTYRSGQETLI